MAQVVSDFRVMVQCEVCHEVFSGDLETCPVCGSSEVTGYKVQNPFSRLPMERVLSVTGHLVWMLGLIACIFFLWHTDTDDASQNWLMVAYGFGVLLFSMIFSVALIGLGELLKRVIRIQRRVRAFMLDQADNC